jgi:hypothetical protein
MMTVKTASTTRSNLSALLTQLEDHIETASLTEVVEIGSILWGLIDQAGKAMDPIKEALRLETLNQTNGEGSQTFSGISPNSSCTVRVPRPTLKVGKKADIEAIRTLLGSRFDKLFSTATSYKPAKDFEDKVFMLNQDEIDTVMGIIERVENTPRVSFSK